MMRAILGVIVGYAVWTVLWLGGNAFFFGAVADQVAAGAPFTSVGPLVFLTALSVVCSIGAGLSAAAIANERANVVVSVTGALLLLTGIAVQIGVWRLMPIWYHLTFLLLIVPVCVAAGRFWHRRSSAAAS